MSNLEAGPTRPVINSLWDISEQTLQDLRN
jgi:hypothetical protein